MHSSLAKVITLIDLWREEQEAIAEAAQGEEVSDVPRTVQKFSDIKGLV